jgi:hypothetical protein
MIEVELDTTRPGPRYFWVLTENGTIIQTDQSEGYATSGDAKRAGIGAKADILRARGQDPTDF